MNKIFLILAFILLIIYCLNNKKESKNKKQVGGKKIIYDKFLLFYKKASEDEYINNKPSSMYNLIINLPPIDEDIIVFFNTIKVLIEGNVKGSLFIGNNRQQKINKIFFVNKRGTDEIYSNFEHINSHINLVNEVYTLKRDRKGRDYYEHNETKQIIYTHPFVKLENNTILKFQKGENLKDYIIALKNEYIPHSRSPPHSMLKYLSLYKNLNDNTLSSFNHIKLLIESSTNKQAAAFDIIRMIQDNKGIEIRDMVLRKLNKWSMESSLFPGYMITDRQTKPGGLPKIDYIEKYVDRKDILDKLERAKNTTSITVSPAKPLEAKNTTSTTVSPAKPLEAKNISDTDEAPLYDESAEASQYEVSNDQAINDTSGDGPAPTPDIDFEKQYYILKDQNEKLEKNLKDSLEENDSLEKDLYNTRQQLKKNRGKLESFHVMEDVDKNRDGLISRLELEDIFTGNKEKKGGSLDDYYKLL